MAGRRRNRQPLRGEVRFRHHGAWGVVHRAHHRRWNIDLAIKSPRREFFRTARNRRTASASMNAALGLTSAFIRTLPPAITSASWRVFLASSRSSLTAGRSLTGSRAEGLQLREISRALARMLDVGIQVAWGLGIMPHTTGFGALRREAIQRPGDRLVTSKGHGFRSVEGDWAAPFARRRPTGIWESWLVDAGLQFT